MSEAPTPPGGGNMKFLVAGLVLLLAAGGLAFLLLKPSAPAPHEASPAVEVAVPKEPERANPLEQQDLLLGLEEPPAEPDAAEPEPAPEPAPEPKKVVKPARDVWDCSGELPKDAVMKVVAAYRPQVRTCYERRLKANNMLQGDVQLQVKVGADGTVVTTATSGSLKDKEVFQCIRALAKSWRFPVPTGGNCAVVQVPFSFTPMQ